MAANIYSLLILDAGTINKMDLYYNVVGQGVIIMSFFVDLYQCMRMFTLLR